MLIDAETMTLDVPVERLRNMEASEAIIER
jgi:hypothetical protein